MQLSLYHVIVRPTKIIKDLCEASTLNAIYVLALQRSLIILVGLTMTCFSEKMMISYSCMHIWFHAQLAQKILNGIYLNIFRIS